MKTEEEIKNDAIKNQAAEQNYINNKDGSDPPTVKSEINAEYYLKISHLEIDPRVIQIPTLRRHFFRVNKNTLYYGDQSVFLN